MSKNSFKVLRPGINTTFQDLGRDNLYHVGLPFSGAIDKRNFLIANSIIANRELLSVTGERTTSLPKGKLQALTAKKHAIVPVDTALA